MGRILEAVNMRASLAGSHDACTAPSGIQVRYSENEPFSLAREKFGNFRMIIS
jgi:hypothetical protein